MKRRIPGFSRAALPISDVPDGLYLVRVERIQYRWDKQKPHYKVQLQVVEPKHLAGTSLPGRLWCTEKALWKLSWFLREFDFDTELLGRILGAAEGRFGVDHPVLSKQWPQPGSEDLGLREQCQGPGKVQLSVQQGRLETQWRSTWG